ncbi:MULTISPECIES: aspartate/glutamate racemase family protein [unclassified Pseudoalteromonas]|uniref:aspartate/glutamate racemase family protein n=1 Tax=unclassified Pseudoalteromonas TaxID=194690 RepID=UPI0018915715|nr:MULTISPECIES: aspartate/glutamate racemase family protein [unclassified Pseudoalteromonas]MCG7560173.1 aspartate/glutamate racemase family protein [Pseudoalteromonas sp. McH1-42]
MKTIGLIGGMSWESTVSYYSLLNEGVKAQLGGLHSAKIVLVSVDFAEVEAQQHRGDWQAAADLLATAAQSVEAAGAEFVLICTNTMHKVADEVQQAISIPLLHIADATGRVLVRDKVKKVGLLGTRFTMQEAFYRTRLEKKFGLEVCVPNESDQQKVHDVIYQELCLGKVLDKSREDYLRIIASLKASGAEAVILGCTEIALLIRDSDTDIPVYDTTRIHVQSALEASLE